MSDSGPASLSPAPVSEARPLDAFVSVIAPLFDDADIVEAFIAETMLILRQTSTNYELVLVDDGSDDDTVARVEAAIARTECVRLLRLSRPFGREAAVAAGLDAVIGDYTVVIAPAFDPPSVIREMVNVLHTGSARMVIGTRRRPTASIPYRVAAALFRIYCRRMLKLRLPPGMTGLVALKRQALNALLQLRDRRQLLRAIVGKIGQLGRDAHSFPYDPVSRRPSGARPTLRSGVERALDIIFSHPAQPLRGISLLGLGASTLALAYMVYVVVIFAAKKHVAEGWVTQSLQIAVMFFCTSLILAAMCEYIGRALATLASDPFYQVLDERSSHAMIADLERRNLEEVNDGGRDAR